MAKDEKKKASAPKNVAETFDLNMVSPGVITLEGVVKDNSNKTILLNRKRDGSSKRMIEAIPKDQIIFVVGGLALGDNAKITYMDVRAPAMRKMRRVTIEGADKETGMLKGQNEKGEAILINSAYSKLTSSKESEISGPDETVKKKKAPKKA
jgi:hypothetical protein